MIKALIVDDSVVFRNQISKALSTNNNIEIVATAANGSIALQRLEQHKVDIVTLDMEMPEMDGIEVLREIRKKKLPVRVIFFSSQTQAGAKLALLALREGADDVVAKPIGEEYSIETVSTIIGEALIPKILQFNYDSQQEISSPPYHHKTLKEISPKKVDTKNQLININPSILLIGSSTGGPSALEKIFSQLKAPVTVPILIVQHMPPVFTESLAKRLGELSGISSTEAKSGTLIEKNHLYVAPGNFHMILKQTPFGVEIRLNQEPQRNSVRPAVDNLFESASSIYGNKCLGLVLTGMGEDGFVGGKAIRKNKGHVMIQDKESCVVFGMPGALFQAEEYDWIGNLEEIFQTINDLFKKRIN